MPQALARCQAFFASGLQRVLGILFPPTCIGCHARLPGAEPSGFCALCYGQLPWWNPSHILPPPLPAPLGSFSAPLLYQGPVRSAILHFKFHDSPLHAAPLASLMRFHIPQNLANPLLVPVPSHPKRLRQRLYNHSALLAQTLARQTGLPCNVMALKRLYHSTSQNQKTRAQRLQLPGTHFAATQAVKNKDIILIDDIFTTGATAKACALALKRAGATSVHIRTLAYTAPH